MKASDLPLIVRGVVPILREFLTQQLGSFSDRIVAMETVVANVRDVKDGKPGERGERGADGAQGADGAVGPIGPDGPQGAAGTDGLNGRDGVDGKSITVEELQPVVVAEVSKAVASIQVPKDGADGKDGRDGQDGKSVSVEELQPVVIEAVTKAVASIPVPRDGVDGKNGADGRDGIDGKNVSVEDIRGAIEVEISRALLDFERRAMDVIQRAIERIPPPVDGKDGAPGKDGADGFGFDDLDVEYDGERSFSLKFVRGEKVKEFGSFRLPIPIRRGVWGENGRTDYEQNDVVTWNGSEWTASKATSVKPGLPSAESRAWVLTVKKGSDGKQGPQGPAGAPPKPVKLT